nr:hypothetical protein [Nostoc sp. ChiSLP01]
MWGETGVWGERRERFLHHPPTPPTPPTPPASPMPHARFNRPFSKV